MLRPRLRRQLSWATAPAVISPSQARVLVPLIQTSHYAYYQILALAKALQLRGASVRILICDSTLDGCELKNSRRRDSDPCLTCRHNARDLVGLFGLDVVRLSDLITDTQTRRLREYAAALVSEYPSEHEYKGVEIIRMTNESVTRHYYGAVPSADSPDLRSVRERYLYSALVGVDIAEHQHREWAPTTLMNDMAVYADWAPYAQYFAQRGIPYNLVSMAPFDLSAMTLNMEELYSGTERFERWRSTRETMPLGEIEQRELNALVSERFSSGGSVEQRLEWFGGDASQLLSQIDRSKRNLFLFSNLTWDVGINYDGALYEGVIAWVLDSVRVLAEHPGTHLYVKTHPAESYGSAHSERGVGAAIREHFGELPSNVTIIPPELKIKPYDLFPFIDLGVVYNGTIGLEMMLKDIPVVVTGKAPYEGHGLSTEPRTTAEYADVLLGLVEPASPAPRLIELFAYFYFIKSQIPWRLTKTVYFDDFNGFAFGRLDDLLPGEDPYLDHLCGCILEPEHTVVEAWA